MRMRERLGLRCHIPQHPKCPSTTRGDLVTRSDERGGVRHQPLGPVEVELHQLPVEPGHLPRQLRPLSTGVPSRRHPLCGHPGRDLELVLDLLEPLEHSSLGQMQLDLRSRTRQPRRTSDASICTA